MHDTKPDYANLKDAWQALSSGEERRYARDLATQMGCSEAELVAAGSGQNVTPLNKDFGELIKELGELGEVKILTRNDHVVHEKIGTFAKISVRGPMGIVLNRDIDLRLFLNRWTYGFAVETQIGKDTRENTENDTEKYSRKSLQFFDQQGMAIHKIFLTENSNQNAYKELIAKYRSDEISPEMGVTENDEVPIMTDDAQIDVPALRDSWAKMKDVHQFHSLLKKFNCDRHQSFRLIGSKYAEKLTPLALREVLQEAAREKISIMVFVGNNGCIQIHTGIIEKIKDMGPWINVLDPGFNLHLREDRIAEIWLVRKPTKDGVITTLELFDSENKSFALLCGEREIGNPENTAWSSLAEKMARYQFVTEAAE